MLALGRDRKYIAESNRYMIFVQCNIVYCNAPKCLLYGSTEGPGLQCDAFGYGANEM
jgi:hypothetical protein